ncbi:MAG: hypothetical protein HKO59_12165 [Phycisphaerales bacterium]|nr:hypothetical protein [Phycisphaerae bacterium]NNF43259.1 hypothetical protein [Phycisphaerales bacterium]NNM26717.1 hypothetical protein [Phycisphaerales bacterium]
MPIGVLMMRCPTLFTAAGLMLGPTLLPFPSSAGTTVRPAASTSAAVLVSAPALPPPPAPIVVDPPPASEDPVVQLLDRLESRSVDLEAFTATLSYETEDAFLGQVVKRKGALLYRIDPATTRAGFAILFDVMIEDRRQFDRAMHYIFRDGWLVEVDHAQKQFIKRQVTPPGAAHDPLKLGEGPFPLPIGQRRDDVLERFHVTLQPLPESGPLARLREAGPLDGLRLVPRAGGRAAKDIARVDLFYDRLTRLPVGIDLRETNGDRKTVRLRDVIVNPTLTDADLAKLDIDEPDPRQWHIDRRPLPDR